MDTSSIHARFRLVSIGGFRIDAEASDRTNPTDTTALVTDRITQPTGINHYTSRTNQLDCTRMTACARPTIFTNIEEPAMKYRLPCSAMIMVITALIGCENQNYHSSFHGHYSSGDPYGWGHRARHLHHFHARKHELQRNFYHRGHTIRSHPIEHARRRPPSRNSSNQTQSDTSSSGPTASTGSRPIYDSPQPSWTPKPAPTLKRSPQTGSTTLSRPSSSNKSSTTKKKAAPKKSPSKRGGTKDNGPSSSSRTYKPPRSSNRN